MHHTRMVQPEKPKRQEWEAQYVAAFVAQKYPGQRVRLHARLGSDPEPTSDLYLTPEEERMLRVRMRWADAIIFLERETIIIEGKLRASEMLKAIGELELYVRLLPSTGEYRDMIAKKVSGLLLSPIPDPSVEKLAREKGFYFVRWAPPWIQSYLDQLAGRSARPIRPLEAKLL